MVCCWLPALPTLRLPSIPVGISSYRLLNLDDSFEKKEVLAEFKLEVSCKDCCYSSHQVCARPSSMHYQKQASWL